MKEQILQLRSEGKTYNEIRELLGCSKGTISYHIGEGQKDKNRAANARRRVRAREWIAEIKQDLKCSICGEDRWWVLDFHHKDPSQKEAGIARMLKRKSKEVILSEMEKCDVLCSNCHRDLHHKEREVPMMERDTCQS